MSTTEQRLGPEAQRAACEQWARLQGVGIIAWFADSGVSGAAELEDRPGLIGAVAALGQYQAGILLVAKRDRLARDAAVAALIDRSVGQAGARVVCADGLGNGEEPGELFLRTVIDGAAAYERQLIGQRTVAVLAAKKARGERAGTVAFGYRLSPDGRHVEPDAEEQTIIARIQAARPTHSLRAITADLAAAGVVGRSGKPLQLTQVARLTSRKSEQAPREAAAPEDAGEEAPESPEARGQPSSGGEGGC